MTKRHRTSPSRRRWMAWEVEFLRRFYADHVTAHLAVVLDRPVVRVYAKASHLGLVKSAEFLANDRGGRILKGGRLSVATQFKPGLVPWNKGLQGVAGVQAACRATQFKKGRKPQTWRPVGTHRLTKDGYLERKVHDTGYPPHDWVGVHRLVWIEAKGPVPAGAVVVFRPGCKTTDVACITVERLECISRAENMQRNSFHRHGPEIAQLVQLRGAITRQINKRAKEVK